MDKHHALADKLLLLRPDFFNADYTRFLHRLKKINIWYTKKFKLLGYLK